MRILVTQKVCIQRKNGDKEVYPSPVWHKKHKKNFYKEKKEKRKGNVTPSIKILNHQVLSLPSHRMNGRERRGSVAHILNVFSNPIVSPAPPTASTPVTLTTNPSVK